MRLKNVCIAASAAFVIGAAAPAAIAATATSAWDNFHANASSCAYGHSVVNNTGKSGGTTVHSVDRPTPTSACNTPNGTGYNLPAGWLGVQAQLVNSSTGWVCGTVPFTTNGSATSSFSLNTGITNPSPTACPSSGGNTYRTYGTTFRYNNSAGDGFAESELLVSPGLSFN